MNANSTYWIGKDHTICEDYALAEMNDKHNTAYAIVCDGCSASPDVDVGARILALAAREVILLEYVKEDAEAFGKEIIRVSSQLFRSFPSISPQALDATLLMAWVKDKKLTAYIYGDGVFVHRKKDKINSVHVHLTSGAPDYLSYVLDPFRKKSYDGLVDNRKEVWTSYNGIWDYKPFEPFIMQCPVEEGDVISVISDGINSFRSSDFTSIPWKELIDEFTSYKNFEGEFVQRRISAFKRKCLKEGISHSDDISIASIIV